MKKSLLIIALAMMFAVVQGYAQRNVSSGRTSNRSSATVTRTTSTASRSTATPVRTTSTASRSTATPVRTTSTTSRSTATPVRTASTASRSTATPVRTASTTSRSTATPVRTTSTTSRSTATPVRTTSTASRSTATPVRTTSTTSRSVAAPSRSDADRSYSGRTQPTPQVPHHSGHHAPPPPKPRHGGGHHDPHFRHSHNYHHHHCTFERWAWVAYLGYTHRFVCHSYYADRFFDTILGCYLYGSLRTPNKILVGNTLFHRYSDYISVRCGNNVDCYYVYTDANMLYHVGNNTVNLIVGGGYVTVNIYDNYGNESTYYL